MKVSKIAEILNNWMPTSIAEDFDNVGLIVNSSRKILYSFSKYETFDLEVEQSTKKVQLKMEEILINKSIINA